jgi:hypothetical protein
MNSRPYRAPTRQAANEPKQSMFTAPFLVVMALIAFWTAAATIAIKWDVIVGWIA